MEFASVVLSQEEYQREKSADGLAESGSKRRADYSQLENGDKQRVQDHVGAACGNYDHQSELRAFRGYEEALEHVLEHEHCVEYKTCTCVGHAVAYHFALGAEQLSDLLRKDDAQNGGRYSEDQREYYHHREYAPCLVVVLFAEVLCDEGAAAGSDHESDAAQDHKERHDKVYAGERSFSDVV